MLEKVVIVDCNHGYFEPELKTAHEYDVNLVILANKSYDYSEILKHCFDADAIIVQRFPVDKQFITNLSKCKVVARYGVGLDNIDLHSLQNIECVYFPGFCTAEVATHASAAILWLYRNIDCLVDSKHELPSIWGRPILFPSLNAPASTIVGIVGLGRIGKRVSRIMNACGFHVIACDPYLKLSDFAEYNVCPVDKDTLFEESNIISLHLPLTSETKHFVSSREFDMMQDGSVLVNTARGLIVDKVALFSALKGPLRAAFVDVCDPEPPGTEWLNIPNLHVTNHCAFYSKQALHSLKSEIIVKVMGKLRAM
jgi:D-3-phosphoglycerate dehydrogenase